VYGLFFVESAAFNAVQQQSANANGVTDVFLADQQLALQLASSGYVAATTHNPQVASQSASLGAQSFSLQSSTQGRRLAQFASDSSPIPASSQTTDASLNFFSLPPFSVQRNTGIKIPVGTQVSLRIDLEDYIGELFVIAYYEP
jgi:hypothetical protein